MTTNYPPCYQPGARLIIEMWRRPNLTYEEAVAWTAADWAKHQKEHGCQAI